MIASGEVLQKRYRIDGKIGQGGMGAVYVATDERFGSVVAIKETLCMDDSFRKAIEREARLLNSLRHLALPRVTDHFEENDSQYLVMEFIPGQDLGHILEDTEEPFTVDQVISWADQLLDALDFLHNQEIPVIHRDIKPQNLKTTLEGQIILLDFGLAKGNPTDAGRHTAAKSIFGYSRNYASLEQIQGTGTDPRSDLYSLSATLYHLLTGRPPEDALTRAMAVLSGSPDPLVPANAIREEIPKGLTGVLMSSMDLNAAGRPATAKEMRQMLRESDNYAHLADSRPTVATAAISGADPATHAVNSATLAGREVGAEAKTEIMPVFDSQETEVRTPSRVATVPVRSTKRWPRAVTASLASLILVVVAVGTGAYYYSDAVGFINRDPVEVTEPVGVPAANSNASSMSNGTDPMISDANTAPTETESSVNHSPSNKSADSVKSSKQPQSAKRSSPDETINIQAPPDEDMPGDVVITKKNPDGSTTTTRILKGKPPTPNVGAPSANTGHRYPNDVDMQYLTPAQRRKLRELMRANGAVPSPPGTQPRKP